jgi:hypothetical protein
MIGGTLGPIKVRRDDLTQSTSSLIAVSEHVMLALRAQLRTPRPVMVIGAAYELPAVTALPAAITYNDSCHGCSARRANHRGADVSTAWHVPA